MSNEELLSILKTTKDSLQSEGVNIVGVTGSYARGDNTQESDVDILYEIPNPQEFAQKYGGFGAFTKLEEIKKSLEDKLGKKVDLIARSSLNEVGRKYILSDLRYV